MQLVSLYEMAGRIETRKVLRPGPQGPRMEISFSGALAGRGRLAELSGQMSCTFVASPESPGVYGWRGEAIGFGAEGPAFTAHSRGVGTRDGDHFVYRGGMRLRAFDPSLCWLEELACVFEYRQHATTLAVQVGCQVLAPDEG